MKKQSTSKAKAANEIKGDIPELTRAQLGKGVRGKYFDAYTRSSNVIVLKPELQKAFPTSEAVNRALATVLAFAEEAKSITAKKTQKSTKRRSA
jgi:hypothetical protein